MKKQTLLGAVALTTIAVAGGAHAGTLSLDAAVTGNTIKAGHIVATEVTLDAASTAKGAVGLALAPSASAILPSGNAKLTVTLTGGATFGSPVTAGAVKQTVGGCDPTTVVSTGGGANESTVTFLVSNLGGCVTAKPLTMLIPIQLAVGSTAPVDVQTNLTTEAGTAIDGGTATTFVAGATPAADTHLIKFGKAFDVQFTAAATPVKAQLSDFKSLSSSSLGKATLSVATAAYGGISTAAGVTPLAIGNVAGAKFTLTGDFTTVDVSVAGSGLAAATKATETKAGSGIATVVTTTAPTIAGDYPVTVAAKSTPVVIKGSAYTIAADLTLTSGLNTAGQFGPAALQSITREGSSYLLPWVASGALSTTSTSNTVVRIANVGAAATGAVSIELLTSSKGVAASTALVPVATSIAKGGELVLTSQSFQDKLGADFGRGDIRVTVEGDVKDLIVRRFVQSTVNGALSEVSLGRSATGQQPQN